MLSDFVKPALVEALAYRERSDLLLRSFDPVDRVKEIDALDHIWPGDIRVLSHLLGNEGKQAFPEQLLERFKNALIQRLDLRCRVGRKKSKFHIREIGVRMR